MNYDFEALHLKFDKRMVNAIKWRKKIFEQDARDPNFDLPLSSLNKDLTPKGTVKLITKIKNYA